MYYSTGTPLLVLALSNEREGKIRYYGYRNTYCTKVNLKGKMTHKRKVDGNSTSAGTVLLRMIPTGMQVHKCFAPICRDQLH